MRLEKWMSAIRLLEPVWNTLILGALLFFYSASTGHQINEARLEEPGWTSRQSARGLELEDFFSPAGVPRGLSASK